MAIIGINYNTIISKAFETKVLLKLFSSLVLITLCFAVFVANSKMAIANDQMFEILEEADNLVKIVPQQSKRAAENFLTTRILASNDSDNTAESQREPEHLVRTLPTTIYALQISSKAKFVLGDIDGALKSITQAESIARRNELPVYLLQSQIIKANTLWLANQKYNEVTQLIASIENRITKLNELENSEEQSINKLHYNLLMLKAKVSSSSNQPQRADNLYEEAASYLPKLNNHKINIKHQIELGVHYLTYQHYNRALYQLLSAYWSAIELDEPILLAEINRHLANLFYQKQVLDTALEHLSQAADFYGNYTNAIVLPDVLKLMADIYYSQGRFNLALAHYFNVMDSIPVNQDAIKLIEAKLDLAKTYLQLYNFLLTEDYLHEANILLTKVKQNSLTVQSLLLQAKLELYKENSNLALKLAFSALTIAKEIDNRDSQINAYLLLTEIYEHINDYVNSYKSAKIYNKLITDKLNHQLEISEEDFRQQKVFIERSLHYKNQTEELSLSEQEISRYKYSISIVLILTFLLILIIIRQTILIRKKKAQLHNLYNDHYTHPRSGLRNLRLLNVKLPSSLEQSSANFEQWQTGDLINEPLHDKLRFVMIDLPLLRRVYEEKGYNAGLRVEKGFGDYIKTKINRPARLYHFSDAVFLYVEPNTNPDKTAEELFSQINQWIAEFPADEQVGKEIITGIADYPFLPKAYTAINDKELIDILLMALKLARSINKDQQDSQWVYFRAIENAPAASFVNEDIRSDCKEAINKGLIKISSSIKIEESVINSTI